MCNEKIYTDKTLLLLQESLEQFFYIWNIVSFFREYLLLGCVAFKKLSIIFVKNKKWLNIYIKKTIWNMVGSHSTIPHGSDIWGSMIFTT